MEHFTYTYFHLDWRALPLLIAKWGGKPLRHRFIGAPGDAGPSWPELKPTTPLGQLPVLEREGKPMLAQSGVIARYLAAHCGLVPADEEERLRSEELAAFGEDILMDLYRCKMAPENTSKVAWTTYLDPTNARGLHQRRLAIGERLAKEGTLRSDPKTVALGDLATFDAVCYLNRNVDASLLAGYPSLKAWYESLAATPACAWYIHELLAHTPVFCKRE